MPADDAPAWNLPAALAAWAFPGLGHVLLGQTHRGVALGVVVTGVAVLGLLVGGITVVDARDQRLAFLGQAMIAPMIAAEAVRNSYDAREPMPQPDNDPLYEPSFGRPRQVGVLYTAMAGMLNALVILDALHGGKHPKAAAPPARA